MWLLYKSGNVAKNKNNNNKKEWNCRMVKRQVGILACLPLGVVILEMITTGVVLHFGTDPQEGAFPEAGTGHFLEIGEEERSLSRERNHKPSHSFSRSRSRSRSNERK